MQDNRNAMILGGNLSSDLSQPKLRWLASSYTECKRFCTSAHVRWFSKHKCAVSNASQHWHILPTVVHCS